MRDGTSGAHIGHFNKIALSLEIAWPLGLGSAEKRVPKDIFGMAVNRHLHLTTKR